MMYLTALIADDYNLLISSKMVPVIVTFLSLLFTTGQSTPTSTYSALKPGSRLPLPARTIVQADSVGIWLENIAVRKNGALLVTQLRPAILLAVQDPTSRTPSLDSIYTWTAPNVTDLLGITETSPDTFNVIAGNATADAQGYPGTFSSWEVKFASPSSQTPSVRKIANIPEAKLLNGNVALPANPSIVLIADSQFGQLFRLDTRTGRYEVLASGPQLKPYPEIHGDAVGFGINGVKIRGDYLYFSNSNLCTIFRVRITPDGYIARRGDVEASIEKYADLNALATFVDDFAVGEDGTIWALTNFDNTVIAVRPGGKAEIVVGSRGELTVAGAPAAAFGRGKKDREILYVSTAGALGAPVNGTITEPGKIVAVDTKGYCG